MGQRATGAAGYLADLLRGDDGVAAALASLLTDSSGTSTPVQVYQLNAPAELIEKAANIKYPAMYVFCDRITNTLKQKFRSFSGSADVSVDVRVSHDHLERVQTILETYVQSVTDILDRSRGSWTDTMFYTGGYEIVFSPVKRGGRNYLQTARVRVEIFIDAD